MRSDFASVKRGAAILDAWSVARHKGASGEIVEAPTTAPANDPQGISEDALALIFERRHGESLRYCHTAGTWYRWTGTRWEQERTQLAFAWAREICRDFGSGQAKFAKAATAAAVERFASAARCFAVTADVWDRASWLIGTPGGTVDLSTGELRDAVPDEHITRQAGTTPAPAGIAPSLWLTFLEDATRGDDALIRFLQQVAGYALTGDTSEHALFFIYGAGGNGISFPEHHYWHPWGVRADRCNGYLHG